MILAVLVSPCCAGLASLLLSLGLARPDQVLASILMASVPR